APSGSGAAAGTPGTGASRLAGQAVAYAACMRSHGVPDYPEPKVSIHGDEASVAVAARPGPNFDSAQQACRKLMPGGGPGSGRRPVLSAAEQAQYLRLAACIRSHGVPHFPDPTFSGGGVHLPKGSVDVHSPPVQAAIRQCGSLIPASARGGG
ncbi:MAG: hypothetical protein KGJ43_04320, partial [Acidobacteriota bacterium]|nr:hypothetical protein [Acidobacteriota bacterium]